MGWTTKGRAMVQRHETEWTTWGTIVSLMSLQQEIQGGEGQEMRPEKHCGQDTETLLVHVKELRHSSVGQGMSLRGYFEQ